MLLAVEVSLLSTAFDLLAVPLSEMLSLPAFLPGMNSSLSSSISSSNQLRNYTLAALTRKKLVGPLSYAHCPVLRLCIDAASLQQVKEQVRAVWEQHRKNGDLDREKIRLQRVSIEVVHEGEERKEQNTNNSGISLNRDFYMPFIAIEESPFLSGIHDELVQALRPFHQVSVMDASQPKDRGEILKGFHDDFPLDSVNASRDVREIFCNFSGYEDEASHTTETNLPVDETGGIRSENPSNNSFYPRIYLGCCENEEDLHLLQIRPTDVSLRNCLLRLSHLGGFLSCHELL